MNNYKYKFSVVTAVYNVENYVAETIESLICQDIGFSNVQLILVDDGSPDKSGEICDSYAEKYPNITVIHKENGGVSSARNKGLEIVEGKYVNFIDSDDCFTPNTFSEIWNFFENHYNETDVVAIPLTYFEGKTGNHYLNYKFSNKNRVADLTNEFDCVQMHVASVFFKNSVVKDLRFDTRLAYAEDSLFTQSAIMKKQTLGLVSSCNYLYRVRKNGVASAIQSGTQKPAWYLPTLKYFHNQLIDLSIKNIGYLPKYLQMVLMYDLQWRFKMQNIPEGVLTDEQIEEYKALLIGNLKYFDDEIIMAQRNIVRDYKYYILSLKYGNEPQKEIKNNDLIYRFSEQTAFKISRFKLNYEILDISDNTLNIEGYVNTVKLPFESCEVVVSLDGDYIKCSSIERNIKSCSLGTEVSKALGFKASIPLGEREKYELAFYLLVDGVYIPLRRTLLKTFMPIAARYKNSYAHKGNWIVSINKNRVYVYKATAKRKIAREIKLLFEMLFSDAKKSRKAMFYRIIIKICKLFYKKPVWLISDRASVAGDNGEAFFRYMCENQKEIDARFVIIGDSPDYKRLKSIGAVVKRASLKHKILAMLCEYNISSHAENEIYNPFGSSLQGFKDIWSNSKFIFLQHGITQNDISGWVGKYSKNFSGFVTAAKPEHKSIIDGNYNYTENQVWLTGFPRFDRLYDNSQKLITLMPTWRKYLADKWDPETDLWSLVSYFEKSDYFRFYNGLINNEKLLSAAERLGYKIRFFPHPTLQPYLDRFDKDVRVEFLTKGTEYREVYATSDLVITDYSSAAFDFSYLRKPIIYTHFDKEEFYGGAHIAQRGHFDYERDGFGEVEYTLDGTVDRIIEYMEKGCELKDKYRERIDNFFAFDDKNNCERLYKKLVNKG